MTNTKNTRLSNFELLRIIAMIMILLCHYVGWRGISIPEFNTKFEFFNVSVLTTSYLFGRVGVNIFFIMSGYFLCQSIFSVKRLFRVWFEVFFYSIVLFIISVVCFSVNYNKLSFYTVCLPFISGEYWFFSTYLFVYLLSPFLNIFIKKIGQKVHLTLILILFFFWSFLDSVLIDRFFFNCSFVEWGIFAYLVGAYIRLYPFGILSKKKLNAILSFLFIILDIFWAIFWIILSKKIALLKNHIAFATYWQNLTKCINVFISITLFNVFRLINIKNNKTINLLAKSCFSVYLIHTSPFFEQVLVTKLKVFDFTYSKLLIPHIIAFVAGVFLGCVLIDQIRIYLIEKPTMKILSKPLDKADKKLLSFMDKLISKFFV